MRERWVEYVTAIPKEEYLINLQTDTDVYGLASGLKRYLTPIDAHRHSRRIGGDRQGPGSLGGNGGTILSLTPAGKAYIERLRQEKQEWLARVLHERTTPREKEVLSEAMTILTKLIDE